MHKISDKDKRYYEIDQFVNAVDMGIKVDDDCDNKDD